VAMKAQKTATPCIELPTDALMRVRSCLGDVLVSSSPSLRSAVDQQLATTGKFIRPMMLFQSGIVFGAAIDDRMIALATVIELVHMATLVHDDVLDEGSLRRGQQTLHVLMGNKTSILLGDYMLSKALGLLTRHGDREIFQLVTDAVSAVFEGELAQQSFRGSLKLSEETYLTIVKQKTGALFSAAAQIGALLGGASQQATELLSTFGLFVGAAFQVADDYIDYAGSVEKSGKAIGTDLREGVATLPLLYALRNATNDDRLFMKNCFDFTDVSSSDFAKLLAIFRRHGALEYAAGYAKDLCQQAIFSLSTSPHSAKLAPLCSFSSNLIRSRLNTERR
jgi:octaprenyl-diphosphate synthase